MNPEAVNQLLVQALNELARARRHLDYSHRRVANLPTNLDAASPEELESAEAFAGRFARTVDLLVNKVLRSLDRAELFPRAPSWTPSTVPNNAAWYSRPPCCGR